MTLENTKLSYALGFGFQASNNEAKYKALFVKLRWAKLEIFSDS